MAKKPYQPYKPPAEPKGETLETVFEDEDVPMPQGPLQPIFPPGAATMSNGVFLDGLTKEFRELVGSLEKKRATTEIILRAWTVDGKLNGPAKLSLSYAFRPGM